MVIKAKKNTTCTALILLGTEFIQTSRVSVKKYMYQHLFCDKSNKSQTQKMKRSISQIVQNNLAHHSLFIYLYEYLLTSQVFVVLILYLAVKKRRGKSEKKGHQQQLPYKFFANLSPKKILLSFVYTSLHHFCWWSFFGSLPS